MKLHESPAVFAQLITELSLAGHIPAAFLEKDYWLTTALKHLSNHAHRELFVFKGGTSLSKAYGMIQRFSEDVDLAIIADSLSGNQVRSRMKTVGKAITKDLPEITVDGVTSKASRFRRTAHHFSSTVVMPGQVQMHPYLILEINAFGNPHPFQMVELQSMIGQYLEQHEQPEIVKQYELESFPMQVLRPERTFGEKVLAIVRASYATNPTQQLQNKVRHLYDLHMMMASPALQSFFSSDDFFSTLRVVQTDDARNHEFQGDWAQQPLTDALLFQERNELWDALEQTYTGSFAPLVYGSLPEFSTIKQSIQQLKTRLYTFDSFDTSP